MFHTYNGDLKSSPEANTGDRFDDLTIIIVNRRERNVYGGGDVHMEALTNIFRKRYNIDISEVLISFHFQKFNVFSNVVSLLESLVSKVEIKSIELHRNILVIAPNPFPVYLITAIKLSRKIKGFPVVYFHHLSLSLKFILRRGALRTLANYSLNVITLSICKLLNIPIFLDHPDSCRVKGLDVFKDEDAPNKLIDFSIVTAKKEFDLCYIGRFEKHKGALDIIRMASLLKKNNFRVKIAIIGHINKNFENKIRKILRLNNISASFTFFGTLSDRAKFDILKSSRAYLHLSYEEGWGMSVMDAAYFGIPIIAYDLPAYSYLKRKYNIVKTGDVRKVADMVMSVLSNYSDATRIANEARQIVSAYDYTDIAKYHISVYREIIKKRTL